MVMYYYLFVIYNGKILDIWYFNSDYMKVDVVYVDDDGENVEDVMWDVN